MSTGPRSYSTLTSEPAPSLAHLLAWLELQGPDGLYTLCGQDLARAYRMEFMSEIATESGGTTSVERADR